MNNALPKTTVKPWNNIELDIPLICNNGPSVCLYNLDNVPFVSLNIPKRRLQPVNRQMHGVSLIELIVTMVVASILVAIALPTFRAIIQNTHITTQVNDLIGDLNFARSEAITRRGQIVVCPSTNGTACTGGNWKDGRLIFVDTDKDLALGGTETILRFRGAGGDSNSTLVASSNPVFLSSGVTNASTIFKICDDRGATYGKTVTLSSTGQATVSPTAPSTCTN
jgi:type IV fimbrial biogenesis protein FimT